ncbi:Translation initiation factor eIF-2B subunit gamma [Extremus antarcticus]|uniref:Translation initiation factor eIF2B subunit gamma n=1 Tax=Extremus antarcticus TaxID=702011 RepID=A0AAJ0DFW9_9PEZI|nr:Translation initiation factor eIF-2B subunit gamma [Extremus antarcticus]
MPHATNLPTPRLQALILCGPGVSLNTFTSSPADLPKALLPIANRPMVWYPLDWCYRMGLTSITLITPPESAPALEAALATNPALTNLPNPKPEVLAPEGLSQTTGTGELLRLESVQRCITGDFVVLPCDLVCEVEGTRVLQQWMTLNPLPAGSVKAGKRAGGMAVFYPTHGLEGISTKKDETDFIATVPIAQPAVPPPQSSLRGNIEQIVVSMPTDTLNDKLEEDKGFLRLRQSLMERHGRVKMRMKWRDAGVYVFPKWVKDFAKANDRFDSISEDVLGWWAKAGWQEGLAEKLGLREVLEPAQPTDDSGGDGGAEDEEDDIDAAALSTTKSSRPPPQQKQSLFFATRVHTTPSAQRQPLTVPPLLAYIAPSPSPLIRRVDTSAQLLTISLYLAKLPLDHPLSHDAKVHPSAQLDQQTRVSLEDSLIAENVKLGFRSNVKESVIGAGCEIGKNVRITRSLLMEGVVVGDGCVLVGCIVGRRARIEGVKVAAAPAGEGEAGATDGVWKEKQKKKKGEVDEDEERTRLTECEVAPNYVVEAGTEAKGEKMMGFDTEGDDEEGFGAGEEEEEDEMEE